jgi:hypothetical protein
MDGQRIGFIQTVELLEWRAEYEGIRQPFIAHVHDAIDQNPYAPPGLETPWFNTEGHESGPQPLSAPHGTPSPTLNDSPDGAFQVFGHRSRAENPLRNVTTTGKFWVWLVVKHEDDPGNQVSSLNFLYHLKIEYARSWVYNRTPVTAGPAPQNFWQRGAQSITVEGVGSVPSQPVFSDRTAHEHLNKEFDRMSFPGDQPRAVRAGR